jgi:hypothetical protein
VVPIACAAAAAAGLPSVCVSNFSWDYIFAEYIIVAGSQHRSLIWQVRPPTTAAHSGKRLTAAAAVMAFSALNEPIHLDLLQVVPSVIASLCYSRFL